MIDKVFVAAALIQTALTTLRASSRAYHMFRYNSIGLMDGPLILPPQQVNESAFLWELSTAFRHAVMLEARPEMYETDFVETVLADPNVNEQDEYDSSAKASDAYRMSTYGANLQQIEKDKLDAYIEELLLDDGQSDGDTTRSDGDSYYLDGLLDAVTTSGKETDRDNDENSSLIRLENEISEDLTNLKQESAGKLSRLGQGIIRIWRRVLGDLDEASNADDDMECDVESATSFHTKVEIASELSVRKRASVYAYAPEIFRDLRRFFGVSESEYLHSVLQSGPFVSFQSNSKGAARVG
eukprot:scaffold29273_cov144-Amphora_coffeaeformis.AAC.2